MINSVTVTNHVGDEIELVLRRPEDTGLLITSITGLGPGDADINTTELSTTDGSIYNSSRIQSRNIVITLKFLEKPTIEATRHLSYHYFSLKHEVTLKFDTDERQSWISGYVEKNDPTIFSNKETAQISIICPNPFFKSVAKSSTYFSGIEAMFEFPFCNDSLEENLLIMSEIRTKYENVVPYYGDAETGVLINIHFLGTVGNITIYNTKTSEVMTIDIDKLKAIIGSDVVLGDDLVIDTITGEKKAIYTRAGKSWNVLNAIGRDSAWFKLDIGDNIFAFTSDKNESNIQFMIVNDLLYSGV